MKQFHILRFFALLFSVAVLPSSCEKQPEETTMLQRKRPAYIGGEDYFQILDFNLSQTELKLDNQFLDHQKPFPEGICLKAQWVNKNSKDDLPVPLDVTFHYLEQYGPMKVPDIIDESKRTAYIDIIESRVTPVRKSFYDYCEKNNKWQNIKFYNVYVREKPSIVADAVLFGRDAGQDLSDYFYADFGSTLPVSVKKSGNSYVLKEFAGQSVSFRDLFETGSLFSSGFTVGTPALPDDLYAAFSDKPLITLTMTIPVTVDHVWEYALEYGRAVKNNESTDHLIEQFSDAEIVLQGMIGLIGLTNAPI